MEVSKFQIIKQTHIHCFIAFLHFPIVPSPKDMSPLILCVKHDKFRDTDSRLPYKDRDTNPRCKCFLLLTDGETRHLATPQRLSNVLHWLGEYFFISYEHVFHSALPAAIALNDSHLEESPLSSNTLKLTFLESGARV